MIFNTVFYFSQTSISMKRAYDTLEAEMLLKAESEIIVY